MDKQLKTVSVRLKEFDAEAGTGKAVIATLGVVDKDGDIIVSGAIGQQDVRLQPAHDWQNYMIGKAVVYEEGQKMVADFKFNLKTTDGKDWYESLKFDQEVGEPLQEWSFGFDILDSEEETRDGTRVRLLKKLAVHEISPVLLGAGVNTRTTEIKEVKTAFARHSTGTDDSAWSAADNRKRVRQDEKRAYYGRIYAWYDPDGEEGAKGTYRFIHHFVDEDGAPGKASIRACVNAIAVLNGGRGGTTIPDADRKAVWNHVAGHLKDADLDPAPLKDAFSGVQLDTEIKETLQAIMDAQDRAEDLTARVAEVQDMRKRQGRHLDPDKFDGMTVAGLDEAVARLKSIIVTGDISVREEVARVEARNIFHRHGLG